MFTKLVIRLLARPLRTPLITVHRSSAALQCFQTKFQYYYHYSTSPTNAITTDVHKKNECQSNVIQYLEAKLKCETAIAAKVHNEIGEKDVHIEKIKTAIDVLLGENVTVSSIIENPYLLSMSEDHLTTKLQILTSMNPKDINDFVPFMILPIKRLQAMAATHERDLGVLGNNAHRLYFLSKFLETEPKLLAKLFSKKTHMLTISLQSLQLRSMVFKKYKIPAQELLNDLQCFKMSQDTAEARFRLAAAYGHTKFKAWMVKAADVVMKRSLVWNKENRDALGKNKDIGEFFENTINLDRKQLMIYGKKYPRLLTVNPKKAKDIADLLLNETKFTKTSLALCPQVFTYSFKKLKQRVEELKSRNLDLQSIGVLIYDQKAFDIYCQNQESLKSNTDDSTSVISNDAEKKSIIINALLKHLRDCNLADANCIYGKLGALNAVSTEQIQINIKTLSNHNVSQEFILKYHSLLVEQPGVIAEKLNLINMMKPDKIEHYIPLITMRIEDLGHVKDTWAADRSLDNRIYRMSQILDLKPQIIAETMASHPKLFYTGRAFFERKLYLLKKYGMSGTNILSNVSSILVSSRKIENRLKRLHSFGIRNFKMNVFSMSTHKFDSVIAQNKHEKTEIKQRNSHVGEFLCQMLGWKHKTIIRFCRRYPHVLPERVGEMSKIIHHLNTNSFDLKELKRHPHILFLDSDKLANRLAELKMMGHASVTVKLLCSPELIYQSTLQKIKADLTSSKHEDESD